MARTKFRDVWANQTEIGRCFGLSAVAMGKRLKALGLRDDDGRPTKEALAEGFCRSTPLKDGTAFFMWHRRKVMDLMRASGQQPLPRAEVEARRIASEWVALLNDDSLLVEKFGPELFGDLHREARQAHVTERVNELLTEQGFSGDDLLGA